MVDASMGSKTSIAAHDRLRDRVLRRFELGDGAFRIVTQACAIAVLLLLSGVIVSLAYGSAPALSQYGFGFLTS